MLKACSESLMHSLMVFAYSVGWYKNTLSRKTSKKAVLFKALSSDTCLWKRTILISLYLKWQFYNLVGGMGKPFWSYHISNLWCLKELLAFMRARRASGLLEIESEAATVNLCPWEWTVSLSHWMFSLHSVIHLSNNTVDFLGNRCY